MAYKMENKELQIASCSIADLTVKQAQHFTEQWGEGASLGTLTLFYEENTGLLVLNRDNEHYSDYLDIAEGYLSAKKGQRIEIRKEAPATMIETLNVLECCIQERVFIKWADMTTRNNIESAGRKLVEKFIYKYDPYIAAFMAFKAGVIRGKRIERAKKKH